jgi:hypothetical protein
MKKKFILWGILFLFIFVNLHLPQKAHAESILVSPFGGKISSYSPIACEALTAAVAAATAGTVTINVEKITILDTSSKTRDLAMLDIIVGGTPIPLSLLGIQKVHMYYNYFMPGVYVLGDAWSLNKICDSAFGKVLKKFGLDICGIITKTLGKTCGISEIVHQIGTGIYPTK